ncbi:MAG: hypothetical protein ABWZ80_04915 [Beijerinckiaceae bacterium]
MSGLSHIAFGLVAFGAVPVGAQTTGSISPLEIFEGRFAGKGSLARAGGAPRTLDCDLTGRASGDRYSLTGTCHASIIVSANVSIEVRCIGSRCSGSFRDGRGTVSSLVGERRGETLSFLATETAESVRPDPPAHMTLTRRREGIALSVRNTEPTKGSAISLELRKQ